MDWAMVDPSFVMILSHCYPLTTDDMRRVVLPKWQAGRTRDGIVGDYPGERTARILCFASEAATTATRD